MIGAEVKAAKVMGKGLKVALYALAITVLVGIVWGFVHNYQTGQQAKVDLGEFKDANKERRETSSEISDSYGILRSDGYADSARSEETITRHRSNTRRVTNDHPEVDAELNRRIPQQLLDADRAAREAAEPH